MIYLRLEDINVLKFDFSKNYYEIFYPELLPLSLRDRLKDTRDVSDVDVWFDNKELMASFFTNRSINVRRENAKYIMNQLGIKQGNDFASRFKAMIECKALSAADSYWITENENDKWNEVNLLSSPLNESLQQIGLFGSSVKIKGKIQTPELTGQGAYAKAWYCEDGKLYLYKANSPGGNESEREVLASDILDCFNVPHVKYELTKKEGLVVCRCENMNLKNTSLVDSVEADIWAGRNGMNLTELAKKIDSELFYKTIVVDYLISNSDRHGGNWGFYMNNQNGKLIEMHPLFDHNNAFDKNFMHAEDGGICQLLPGKSQKEAALYAIKRCDFRCVKPVEKSMFFDEAMYESFMSRAVEIGLYQKQKITFTDKIFSKKKEPFIPVELKDDNTAEYWKNINSKLFFGNKIQPDKKVENKRENSVEKTQPITKKTQSSGRSISD